MKKFLPVLMVGLMLCTIGCTPIEVVAYRTAVGAKAFVASIKAQHPECVAGSTAAVCVDLDKATHAKDFLVDSIEVYCAGPVFDTGAGVCQPPVKGTPAYDQAVAKVKAAIAGYSQAANDLQGVL